MNELNLKAEQKIESVEEFQFEPIKGQPMLNWRGKRPFTSTQFYPAQLKETFGEETNGWMNKIFWGDNLQVMSHLLKHYRGQVDLIYIDPPFDSKADYKKKIELRGRKAENDKTGFEEKQYTDIWSNDEYLQFMYERIILLRELLSNKGAFYLHCDWHKSHLLRSICDEVFGSSNFCNEIIWQRADPHNDAKTKYGNIHDVILFYNLGTKYNWDSISTSLSESALKEYSWVKLASGKITKYIGQELSEGDVRFKLERATQKGDNPNRFFNWRGISLKPGIQWMGTYEEMEDMLKHGDLYLPNYPQGAQRCRVLPLNGRENSQVIQDIWQDVGRMKGGKGDYPTQKPEALIERIIKASSNPGDLVFDCFMGSGTTQLVAMKLGRRFIGADINVGAIDTTVKRLSTAAKMINESTHSETHYTGFEVWNVNNYDVFRNPIQAKDLLVEALELQPLPDNGLYDGEKDGRMVKIMPINRIATRVDLNELITGFPRDKFDKRKAESPIKPVEQITLVCMGHEPDLGANLKLQMKEEGYNIDVEVLDILRDKVNLEFRRDSEADVQIEGDRLVIRDFYPMNLLQKLSLERTNVEEWRELVDSIKIDFNFDGAVFSPTIIDIPEGKNLVKGSYKIPADAGTIKVKITDLLSESCEVTLNA